MRAKQKMKIAVDILMTLALLLLMPYEMIGEAAHEWMELSCSCFHHSPRSEPEMDRKSAQGQVYAAAGGTGDSGYSDSDRYAGLHDSGIILLPPPCIFVPEHRGLSMVARTVHMTCAYWGFVLMSLHLGIHWGLMVGMAGRLFARPLAARTWIARLAALAAAAYGVYAFVEKRNSGISADAGAFRIL